MNSKVSIIIPTYKNRGGLCESVDSAREQTYGDIEIIVVDDNNPDTEGRKSTEQHMSAYKNDLRVVYLKHSVNKNGAAARNTGIFASKGDYIAFLDDDDFFLKDKIQKQVAYLESHPEYDATYCLARKHNGEDIPTTPYVGDVSKELLMTQSRMFTPTLMFRRQALLDIKGFDESFRRNQDYEMLLRFFATGHKIGCVTEVLTELGTNQGENILTGKKAEDLKNLFFEKFDKYVQAFDRQEPGFANRVYAKHYAGVFLEYIKSKNFLSASRVFLKYFKKSPNVFWGVLYGSLKAHM